MIEAYSYHTNSRFGSRVKILIEDETISITGPRMGVSLFRVWLTIQGILFALIVATLLAGIIFLHPRYFALAVGLFVFHIGGCMVATALWELLNLIGHDTATIRIDEVKKFNRGEGWARGIIRLLIPFYVITMSKISPGYIVSFEAPDKKTKGNVVYALMLWNEEEALRLEMLLSKVARD
jgi:hypothetical protein